MIRICIKLLKKSSVLTYFFLMLISLQVFNLNTTNYKSSTNSNNFDLIKHYDWDSEENITVHSFNTEFTDLDLTLTHILD